VGKNLIQEIIFFAEKINFISSFPQKVVKGSSEIALIESLLSVMAKDFLLFIIFLNYRRDLTLKNPISSKAVSTETMIASSNTVGLPAKRC
tara:strand:+ start:132 stop:404 length:273 start_codon:yes stop_codon:yes gene_type:complete